MILVYFGMMVASCAVYAAEYEPTYEENLSEIIESQYRHIKFIQQLQSRHSERSFMSSDMQSDCSFSDVSALLTSSEKGSSESLYEKGFMIAPTSHTDTKDINQNPIIQKHNSDIESQFNFKASLLLQNFNHYRYKGDAIDELENFLYSTPNVSYQQLKFYKISYDPRKLNMRWSYVPLKARAYYEKERAHALINYFNNDSMFLFDTPVTFCMLFTEPGYTLNEEALYDIDAEAEMNRILDICPVLAPCANNLISWTKKLILIPDYYILFDNRTNINQILNKDLKPFESRLSKLFFSGALSGNIPPITLEKIVQLPRFNLLDFADKYPDLVDCVITNDCHLRNKDVVSPDVKQWYNEKHVRTKKGVSSDYIHHANYKYLLSFDGFGAAWGRIPSILATGSVLCCETNCEQWFYSWLDPYQNYIPVKKDLSNLPYIMAWLEADPERAKKIGENGRLLAERYLTPEANKHYLYSILKVLTRRYPVYHLEHMYNKKFVYQIADMFFSTSKRVMNEFISHCNNYYNFYKMNILEQKLSNIQPIVHRIWLTGEDCPEEVPFELLNYYKRSMIFWSLGEQHFWCMNQSKIPHTVQYLRDLGVHIHDINEISDAFITKKLFDKLIQDKLFGFASNLARFEVMLKCGGLYADIGLEQVTDVQKLYNKFDALFYVKTHGELDICAFAFEKNSLFIREHLEFIARLPEIASLRFELDFKGVPEQAITTSYPIMAALPSFYARNNQLRIGFLKSQDDFVYHGMRKWQSPHVKQKMKENSDYFFDF